MKSPFLWLLAFLDEARVPLDVRMHLITCAAVRLESSLHFIAVSCANEKSVISKIEDSIVTLHERRPELVIRILTDAQESLLMPTTMALNHSEYRLRKCGFCLH